MEQKNHITIEPCASIRGLESTSSRRLDIVVCAHNEAGYLARCLAAIRETCSDLPNGWEVQLIVVDNASTDNTTEIARQFADVIHEPVKGLTRARQAAMAYIGNDLVAFIDADTAMQPGWIQRAVSALDKDVRVVCVSGPVSYYDMGIATSWLLHKLWALSGLLASHTVGYAINGGHFLVKVSALRAIGGFDISIDFYGEDTDLARRLARQGLVKFDPALTMPCSGRRLRGQGIAKTMTIYALHYLATAGLRRQTTTHTKDFR
jgi:glycosyltransferase involved in cell wall biosynthesis